MYALLESHVYLLAFMASFWFNLCITDLLKAFAGRLRPDFLDRCQWSDLHHACTGDPRVIMEGRRSWPSGHSSIAFSTLGFLALFLAAKGGLLRSPVTPAPHATPATHIADARWTPLTPWVKGRAWPFVVAVAPLLVAGYIAISRTVQHIHHPTDVISGSLLGFTIATLAFRNYFTWDGTPRSPLVHLDDDGGDYTRLRDADHA
ncbi:hypothetical protein CXG81DRAFT_13410 [Caulochytrium protostelioides]|uniref:Phosphatidic acid phosphatase type 2/haloperoxidase domain-containing protein n=1 Tax=Caulochytrium protostelioides TaxID=1555241 RepID=A0A4P9X594_9FUNG|nr:hypothetical protein CXG81DRAFT_13410 [Caulochytrium protostelioides]|eukprot:RKP00298.1 hypothetical protein CXG81DRAFT_13410 [Caulochytrium protostelioides]